MLFFSFIFKYIILLYTGFVTIYLWHTLYLFLIYIYDDICCFSPLSPCVVYFLFLYTCLFMYAIHYFCFTLKCHDEFCLKCFINTGYQSLSFHELSSCKIFQEFVLGLDFIVFNKWVWVEWFMTSFICSFVCCGFVLDCQKGRLLGHIWIILGTYANVEVANPLTKCTLLVIR